MDETLSIIGENAPRMDVYQDPENTEEEIDREILENLKKDTPWSKVDFSNYKQKTPETYEEFRKKILDMANEIQRVLNERKAAEQDGILVGPNGQLIQLFGNATTHDWLVWYVKEFKKGKL